MRIYGKAVDFTRLRIKPTQTAQPHEYGHGSGVATCFWFCGNSKPLVLADWGGDIGPHDSPGVDDDDLGLTW